MPERKERIPPRDASLLAMASRIPYSERSRLPDDFLDRFESRRAREVARVLLDPGGGEAGVDAGIEQAVEDLERWASQ